MNNHFESYPQIKQFSSKSIFLSEKKSTSIFCGLCQTFGEQQNLKSQKQIKEKSKIGLKHFPKQDKNLLKSDKKKSLKALGCFNISKNKAQPKQPIQQILKSQKIQQRSTNMNSQIVLYSNLFKRTQSSQKDNHLSQGLVNFSYQQKTLKKLPHSNSCINLKNQENKSLKCNQQKNQLKEFSHVPMTSSLSNQIMSANKNIKISKNKFNGNVIVQNQKLEHLRFKSSISQNFSSLQISPIRQIPIPEQSDRSELVPSGKNNHDQSTINRLLDLQSRQNLIKSDEQDVSSRTFKANQNRNNFQENTTHPFSQIKVISVVPQMQKDFSVKSGSNKDYLQISFDQNEQKLQKKLQSQTIKPEKIMAKEQEIKQTLKNPNEILITVSPEMVLSSDVGTDLNQPQHTQIAQRHDIRIQKKIKTPSTNVFGRYSVQIPKSRNFNNMKVRRTISMKDQQDSSQEETSEVIYGFRNVNNLVVMEDIAEDMQQSYMTRREINLDSIEKSVLQQF